MTEDLDLSLPTRPLPPELTTWSDSLRCRMVFRLSRNNVYVEQSITDEEMVDAPTTQELVHETVAMLCAKWRMRFAERFVPVPPPEEGQQWRVRYDNVIEGEIVVKEIEGGATNATRGCIEGW